MAVKMGDAGRGTGVGGGGGGGGGGDDEVRERTCAVRCRDLGRMGRNCDTMRARGRI